MLIVDDEEIIVNGLYEIFNMQKDLELDVYKAFSSNEAIEWLNRTRIDIVISDIRMPEINGLQLLERIQKSWPQCRTIFLTGYCEFDYAYKAIQHTNVSYLLKSEGPEKVVEAVKNAIEEIKKGMRTEYLISKANEQMNIVQDLLQNDFLLHLLNGDPSLNISKAQFEQLSIPMYSDKPVILLLGQIHSLPGGMSYSEKIQYLYSIRQVILQNLSSLTNSVNVMDTGYRFVFFMQPRELSTCSPDQNQIIIKLYNKMVTLCNAALEAVQTICRDSLNVYINFVLGGEPCSWKDTSQKYYSLRQLLNYQIGTGSEMLLVDNILKNNELYQDTEKEAPELETNDDLLKTLLNDKSLEMLDFYLDSGQIDKYFELLPTLIDPLKPVKSKNNNVAIEAYYRVALCLLSKINRSRLTDRIAFHIGLNKLMRIDEFKTWQDAVDYIYQLSKVIFNLQNEQQNNRVDKTIRFLQQFIKEHLSENLSLVRLSELVYLNPSYLSRLYKQTTGSNLSDFIEKTRINKAMEYLQNDNVKVQEVAQLVGYDSATSFTRFFRKAVKCSPQEYRDSFLQSKQMPGKYNEGNVLSINVNSNCKRTSAK